MSRLALILAGTLALTLLALWRVRLLRVLAAGLTAGTLLALAH